MFKWFNHIRIRNKLISVFLLMISLTIIVSIIALHNQKQVQTTINQLIEVEEQVAKLSLQSQSAMLIAQRSEKDYLLSYANLGFEKARTQYVAEVQKNLLIIFKAIEKIQQLEAQEKAQSTETQAETAEKLTRPFKAIKQGLAEYEGLFLLIVNLVQQRGFKDSGLIGQFRDRILAIEKAINAQNQAQLMIYMLMMRRYEKDYLLNQDNQNVIRLHETVIEFKNHLATTDLTETAKEELLGLVDQYQTQFDQLVAINTQINNYTNNTQTVVTRLSALLEQIYINALNNESLAQTNIQAVVQNTQFIIIGTSMGAIIIGLFIAFWLARLINNPLTLIVQGAKLLTRGNTNLTGIDHTSLMQITQRRDEMGEIGQAFDALARYIKAVISDIVQVSQGLAKGHLQITPTAEYQGDFMEIKTALTVALTDLRQVTDDIVKVSTGLAEGQQEIMPMGEYRGDFIQIKNALETASFKLSEATTRNIVQDWHKTGQTQLNDQMSGEQDLMTLSKNIIAYLTNRLEAQTGLFYLVEEVNRHSQTYRLNLLASYTQTQQKNVAITYQFGEGMVGKAALEKQTIFFTIDAGVDEEIPPHLLALPFLYEDIVRGVIELGFADPITDMQQDFLHQVMPNIGIALNTAESRTQMQALLEQTQAQSEQLKQQQQEMQQNNEELKSQSEELQTQQEELQTQAEELRHNNEELETRTFELERQKAEIGQKNQALEEAQRTLKAKAEEVEIASQYKSEFLANMSHELRTPLNSLLILAQLLATNKDGNLNPKQLEYAQTIHTAGSDLLRLINDILDLSKVEAGKMELNIEKISLVDLMETIDHNFRPLAEQKGVAFRIHIAEDIPVMLNVDIQRLQQILNNLLSNALKFTTEGEVRLDIQQATALGPPPSLGDRTENFLAFSVTDTGIGIPKEKQKLIFEAFQQVDGTTSRRYGGTGLGLSISRQFSRLLGGEIQLYSEEGKGSRFTLYLPQTTDSSEALSPTPLPESERALSPTPLPERAFSPAPLPEGEGKRLGMQMPEALPDIEDDRNSLTTDDSSLLIIEDDRKFLRLLVNLAREKNFKCLIAEDGKTGLQLVDQYHPHAIILDISLPQLDGESVMDRLKENPQTRHIPVHFISAHDHSETAKRMGAIGYLHKPVNMEELNDALNSINHFIHKTVKQVLVIANQEQRQQKISKLVENDNVKPAVSHCGEAYQTLCSSQIDCIILDANAREEADFKFLEQIQQEKTMNHIPIIVYADRDLTTQEDKLLQQCKNHLTLKMVKSQARLLDEVTLFLHQVEDKLPAYQRQMLRMVHDKKAIFRHKKVLVVDDDMRNIFALATVLEEHDLEIIAANNGNEAVAKLEKHGDIDLVLMDIMMPEMDGYEAMRKIRQQPRFRKLPIIALTAKAMKGDKAKCIEAGANDYLAKPVDTDKLLSLMRVWLYQ
jgi:signal transduction histidine kinase/DNA-binding response OmpR family regulator